jgi:hypothetical protein
MTTFTIQLSDGRTAAVEGDDITTRTDGSIWVLRAPPKPLPMTTVAIFVARQWTSCLVGDAQVLFSGEATQPATKPTPTPRFA